MVCYSYEYPVHVTLGCIFDFLIGIEVMLTHLGDMLPKVFAGGHLVSQRKSH